jgi:hypothetical protein
LFYFITAVIFGFEHKVIGAQAQKCFGMILSRIKNYTVILKKKVNGTVHPEPENIKNNTFLENKCA